MGSRLSAGARSHYYVAPAPLARMLALAVNYRAPRRWREKVVSFASALERAFGPRLEAVVALPDPEDRLYDSNVLVVLSGPVTLEDHSTVARLTPEGISPLVTPGDDRASLEAFLLAGGQHVGGLRRLRESEGRARADAEAG